MAVAPHSPPPRPPPRALPRPPQPPGRPAPAPRARSCAGAGAARLCFRLHWGPVDAGGGAAMAEGAVRRGPAAADGVGG